MDPIRVAVVGLGFGAEFIPIYQQYDQTECIAIYRLSKDIDTIHIKLFDMSEYALY
jgi:predicted dehydrogenase